MSTMVDYFLLGTDKQNNCLSLHIQKIGVISKIFFFFFKSLMLTKAEFIWIKNIAKQY